MTTAIEFCEFGKQYGRVSAVEDLSFTVRTGRVVGLIGPNGAGKSTSLRGLLGLIHPTTGHATVFGEAYARLDSPARRIGVHMDGLGFETGMTGRRHLEICAVAAGVSRQRVAPVLEEVGLADVAGRRLGKYSTGMKQRLGLASALLGEPELLVLDEPANGLDPEGIRWLRKLLKAYAERGGTVLLSSHQLAELAQTVDEVVIINRSTVFSGSLDELTDGGKENLEDRYFDLIGTPREQASHA
jgi:ABC-2 type transport system ATP-binding protein